MVLHSTWQLGRQRKSMNRGDVEDDHVEDDAAGGGVGLHLDSSRPQPDKKPGVNRGEHCADIRNVARTLVGTRSLASPACYVTDRKCAWHKAQKASKVRASARSPEAGASLADH